jgi:hypothetical protein
MSEIKHKYFASIATKYTLRIITFTRCLVSCMLFTWGWPTLAETCSKCNYTQSIFGCYRGKVFMFYFWRLATYKPILQFTLRVFFRENLALTLLWHKHTWLFIQQTDSPLCEGKSNRTVLKDLPFNTQVHDRKQKFPVHVSMISLQIVKPIFYHFVFRKKNNNLF